MALQLLPRAQAQAQGVDPAQSLNAALKNFENILTEDQKREFQKSTTTPDIASVIEFVAEIDARNSSATRRCVAPRLCTFLEATQQFTGVVDTFVSSNPIIAALVWGGVKTAILTASNVASYFDKVTSMVMRIGKFSPTYQKFGPLYPDCIGLQRALCDYYAIIINLCVKIIEVSRRTALKQTLSSILNPFESEFKPFLDLLNEATHKINLEVSLASKQADMQAKKLLEYENQQNSTFRPLARNFFQTSLKQQAEANDRRMKLKKGEMAKLKTIIRNNISPIDHDRPLRQIMKQRVPTTAEWFQKELVFDKWKKDPQSAMLWCLGTIGTGKTVIMSNVVDQLRLHTARKRNEIVCYYFCRVDNEATLSARSILGSLARQILDTQIEQSEYETLLSLQESTRDLSTTDVVQFLLSHLEVGQDKKYYVVLDGLDECDGSQVQAVAQAMVELCSKCIGFKIICAGRPGLEKRFKSAAPQYIIMVNEEKVKSDMDHYLTQTLEKCLDSEVLILGDSTIFNKIYSTLRDKSDGMFLWASLCIEELCAQNCDHDILEALNHLPRSLAEIYDRKLHRVRKGRATGQAMKLLQYCGTVKRPLSTMEYGEALSLSLEQKAFDRGKVPNDMNRVVNGCCGLTFVDEEEDTIHYVHRSVKEHLFTTNAQHTAQFEIASVDQNFGFLCMIYLDFTDFKRQLAKVHNGSSIPIKPLQLGTSTLPTRFFKRASSQISQQLLSGHRQLQHFNTREVERKAQDILGDVTSSQLEVELHKRRFQFLNYAKAYWLHHLADFTPEMNSTMWRLFCRCIEDDDVPSHRPWESEQQTDNKGNDIPEAIQWLLIHRHYALLLYYASYQSHVLSENVKDTILRNVDIYNRYRYTEAILRLSNTNKVLNHGLSYAVLDGCIRSLAMLLQAGAEINAQVNGRTALQEAAGGGHIDVVQTLLAAKADVNASPAEYNGRTALQAAAGGGHLDVVQTLLAAKADVNASVALEEAEAKGHTQVVQALLAAGATPRW
ncbi:Ankyrin repeat-containing domain [Penicillium camemberti]|uniref:Ankyrin repeat-containing domain n=1 Tax=Penicillium camemberti (strain FM 013) TaxID=1429867 RepID=A0A0G4PEQ5_PENC3|nr:Ankyrin repeat-containing domain [Penicillium camemberti]